MMISRNLWVMTFGFQLESRRGEALVLSKSPCWGRATCLSELLLPIPGSSLTSSLPVTRLTSNSPTTFSSLSALLAHSCIASHPSLCLKEVVSTQGLKRAILETSGSASIPVNIQTARCPWLCSLAVKSIRKWKQTLVRGGQAKNLLTSSGITSDLIGPIFFF